MAAPTVCIAAGLSVAVDTTVLVLVSVVVATRRCTNLGANICALGGDVVEIEVGVLSSSEGREGRDESELGEEHVVWLGFDLLNVYLLGME
jgi:hypothetical protein